MKAMLIFMQETCNQLINCLDNYADTNEEFELKDTLGKYSTQWSYNFRNHAF